MWDFLFGPGAVNGMPVLSAWLQFLPLAASAVGSIFGKSAGSKSDQRMQENQLISQQNRTLADLYNTQQGAQMQQGNLDLSRKGFTEQARGSRAKQALIASLLGGGLKDASINVPGIQTAQVTGGLRPSSIGEGGKAAMAELYKQALAAQMNPDQFQGGNILAAPQLQGMKQAGGLEKFLNIAGLIGSSIGGIGSMLNQPTKYVPKWELPNQGSGEGS